MPSAGNAKKPNAVPLLLANGTAFVGSAFKTLGRKLASNHEEFVLDPNPIRRFPASPEYRKGHTTSCMILHRNANHTHIKHDCGGVVE